MVGYASRIIRAWILSVILATVRVAQVGLIELTLVLLVLRAVMAVVEPGVVAVDDHLVVTIEICRVATIAGQHLCRYPTT